MNSAQGSRLDSWKEIAEYLGRNARTVSRWAEQRRLPVHRVPGGKRGVVFAFTDEIDAWLLDQKATDLSSLRTAPFIGGTHEPVAPSGLLQRYQPSHRFALPLLRWHIVAAACVVLVVSISVAFTFRPARSHASQLSSVKFGADTLEATDAEGRTLWTHRYPQPFAESYYKRFPGDYSLIRIADFFRDGRKEIAALIPLHSGPNPSQIMQTEIDFFSGNGTLLWRYQPGKAFQFGAHELKAPWAFEDLLVSGAEEQATLWVTAAHHTWGNSFVAELDPRTGRDTLRFVNTGVLYRLNELKTSKGIYLLAGGFNNEWDSGSLAIINENRPFAASPQTPGGRHHCDSCPPGVPDYYFVFPRSEINRISGLYQDPVFDIQIAEDGIQVTKYERFTSGGETTIYLLSPEPPFALLSVRYGSDYDMLHQRWSTEGKISHSLKDCPERLHPQAVRIWTLSRGWVALPVRPAKTDQ